MNVAGARRKRLSAYRRSADYATCAQLWLPLLAYLVTVRSTPRPQPPHCSKTVSSVSTVKARKNLTPGTYNCPLSFVATPTSLESDQLHSSVMTHISPNLLFSYDDTFCKYTFRVAPGYADRELYTLMCHGSF